MNKDLIIGILVSLLLHGGIFGWEKLFPANRVKPHVVKTDDDKLMQMDMPPIEPDKPDKVETLEDEPETTVLAPPTLADQPTLVPVDALTVPLQPPPPPSLSTDKNAISIPVIKAGTVFGAGIKDLFNVKDLDQQPQPRLRAQPRYPAELKRQGITGECLVEFIIDTNGNIVAAQIVRSTNREFENAALEAVRKWTYRPGKKGGRAVNTRCQIPLQFSIDN